MDTMDTWLVGILAVLVFAMIVVEIIKFHLAARILNNKTGDEE